MLSPFRGALAVLVFASSLSAHDTWLSGPATAAPGHSVFFDLTSSGAFPAPEEAVDGGRVARGLCRVAGRKTPLEAQPGVEGTSLRLLGRGLEAGVAACGVSLRPRTLDLEPGDVEHSLEEIGATATIGERWKALPEPRAWRETYVKHAKTFTRLGTKDDPSWSKPLGLGLEIMTLADPTRLRAGGTLAVRLLKGGRPLAGQAVRASQGGKAPAFATTDAEGKASFVLEAEGPWLLAVTELRPGAAKPSEWESDFATLYLTVAP